MKDTRDAYAHLLQSLYDVAVSGAVDIEEMDSLAEVLKARGCPDAAHQIDEGLRDGAKIRAENQ